MRKQMERVGHPPITLVGDHHDSSPKTGHKSPDDQVTKEVISDRRFWIVSPNVTNNRKTVSEWRNASVAFQAAFMGYKSDERSHKQSGYKFAHVISEGDIILIARSHGRQPDVVGFGVVKGKFQKRLRGFVAPEKDRRPGSLRKLSPFIPVTTIPPQLPLIRVLAHTAALRQLNPNTERSHKLICDWMIQQLSDDSVAKENRPASTRPANPNTSLRPLSHKGQLDFTVRTRQMIRVARKAEAELVEEYMRWLEKQRRELKDCNLLWS